MLILYKNTRNLTSVLFRKTSIVVVNSYLTKPVFSEISDINCLLSSMGIAGHTSILSLGAPIPVVFCIGVSVAQGQKTIIVIPQFVSARAREAWRLNINQNDFGVNLGNLTIMRSWDAVKEDDVRTCSHQIIHFWFGEGPLLPAYFRRILRWNW